MISALAAGGGYGQSEAQVLSQEWNYFGVGTWAVALFPPPPPQHSQYHRSDWKHQLALTHVGQRHVEQQHIQVNSL